MKREDFNIVPKLYSTNALIYITYEKKVIGFVESYKEFGYELGKDGKYGKSTKKKRTEKEVSNDYESVIKKYINNNK
jgi:hypothetical protein